MTAPKKSVITSVITAPCAQTQTNKFWEVLQINTSQNLLVWVL